MITIHDAERTDASYRLYNSRSTEAAQLIRPDGSVVHEWSHERGFSWHYAEMLPNGHLVAIDKDRMILELDKASRPVWQHRTHAHHDFARRDNGNTYIVSGRPDTDCPALDPRRLLYLDHIEEATPDGQVVWQWLAEDHIEELASQVDLIVPAPKNFKDWPHINTIEILPDGPAAAQDDRFRAGNLLMCGRHIDAIFVVDPDTDGIVWAWGPGELLGPHMPTMLPNGNLLIYDNGNNTSRTVRGFTRILELEPLSGRIVWKYQCPSSFYSPSRGSSERLPNGNCLIAHSDSGRLFEVTHDGAIVWEFLNENLDDKGRRDPIYRVTHYPVDMAAAALGAE